MSTAATLDLTATLPSLSSVAAPKANSTGDGGGFFSDLLDIINPLQHLPVISTLYRAITGDQIGDVEQVAGDTLYGGLVGLGSSLLNLAFRDVTGKNIGDTVLAFAEDATGIHLGPDGTPAQAAPVALASTQPLASTNALAALDAPSLPTLSGAEVPAAVQTAQGTTVPLVPDATALMSALSAKGIDPALALRALTAYGKSLSLIKP